MVDYDFSRSIHYTVSVFVISNQRILLLKQSRSSYWLLPSGHVEDNELPHEAAIREVREETGLEIELLEKASEKIGEIVTPLPCPRFVALLPCRDKYDFNMYFTAKVTGGELKIDQESRDAKWFSREEIASDENVGPFVRFHVLEILGENNCE
ncbi:MAG: NUDIX domain-containing protein [Candidatus Micrarchaeota archaeon]